MTTKELDEMLFQMVPERYKDYPRILDLARDALVQTVGNHAKELQENFANFLWASLEKECVDLANKGLIDMAVDENGEIVFHKRKE